MQKIADVLLHDVVPVLYVAFWIFLVPKFTLRWGDAVRWLTFPAVYMAYTLVRGYVSHWYPYYFIDVDTIGLSRSLIHAAAIVARISWAGFIVRRYWPMDCPVFPATRYPSPRTAITSGRECLMYPLSGSKGSFEFQQKRKQ